MSSEWLSGLHAIQAAIEAGRRPCYALYTSDLKRAPRELCAMAEARGISIKTVSSQELTRYGGGAIQQGILLQVGPYPYVSFESLLDETAPFYLALDQVQDPHNCGALLRSAYAWGVSGVILSRDQSAPITPAVVKSSAGASEFLPIARVPGLPQHLSNLKQRGVWVLGAAAGGRPISESKLLAEPLVLVMGGEGSGLRQTTIKICDEIVSLPMRSNPAIDSLNVSVAGAVVMWEIAKARGLSR